MRGYAFSHGYIRPLLAGVQSNHAICRIRSVNPDMADVYDDWEKNYTTLIYLNGGFTRQMKETLATLESLDVKNPVTFKFPIPFTPFYEDEDTLGGILTAVGCVIHHRYYAAVAALRRCRDRDFWSLSEDERVTLCTDAMFYEKFAPVPSDFMNYSANEMAFINFMKPFELQV